MTLEGAPELARLAERCGIEGGWVDAWNTPRSTSAATAAGVLAAMGIAAASPAEAARSLRRLEEQEWTRLLPPVLVVRAGETTPRVTVHVPVPAAAAPPRAAVEVLAEAGERLGAVRAGGEIAAAGSRVVRGRTFERLEVPLPAPLPLGYHRLRVSVSRGGRERVGETPLIVCPDRAYLPRELEERGAAGLAIALYGLRSARNDGIGDLGDLRRLAAWAVRELGVSFIGLNPLHATRNRFPYGHSPYLPVSARFGNPLYLETAAIPEAAALSRARAAAAAPGIAALRAAPLVDWDGAARVKYGLLRALFAQFRRAHWDRPGRSARRRAFEDFLASEGEDLESFALFAALEERFAAERLWSWRSWPAAYARPRAPGAREFLARSRDEVLFHQWLQWLLDEQLAAADRDARAAGLALGYYHDLALAVDENGADYWAAQQLYGTGARVGAPPDAFNCDGQDWGFPPPHPERDRAGGHAAFAGLLRRACRHAGLLRIDHAMRLARLFWIPAGMPAAAGTYVRYHADELFAIVALESVRNRTVIVGEDLGVVPAGFRERMARERHCSCRLLWFERREDGSFRAPAEYPREAVVSASTHDLHTLAGFWTGVDLEERRAIGLIPDDAELARARGERRRDRRLLLEALVAEGLLPPDRLGDPGEPAELDGELHNAFTGLLARTPSRLFLVSQEDLFKVAEQQNVPGTVTERPNWVRRMPVALEELATDRRVRDFAAMLRGWVARTGRLVAPTDPAS